jgi:hypothetical protein
MTAKFHAGRVKPKPFQRPSIDLSKSNNVAKREWKDVKLVNIAIGDIIPGLGIIQDIISTGESITVIGKEKSFTLPKDKTIFAFAAHK